MVSNKTVEVHGETVAGDCNNSSGCCPRRLKHNKRKPPRTAARRLMKNRTVHVARECAAVDSISVPSDGFLTWVVYELVLQAERSCAFGLAFLRTAEPRYSRRRRPFFRC